MNSNTFQHKIEAAEFLLSVTKNSCFLKKLAQTEPQNFMNPNWKNQQTFFLFPIKLGNEWMFGLPSFEANKLVLFSMKEIKKDNKFKVYNHNEGLPNWGIKFFLMKIYGLVALIEKKKWK